MTAAELSQLVDSCGADLYRFCRHLTGSTPEAEDLYQETFLKAAELSGRIDPSGNPKSYLISVAVRLWKNKTRKSAWRRRIADVRSTEAGDGSELPLRDPATPTPEESLLERELREAVIRCVNALPDIYRIPVSMYYAADLPVREIAAVLHLPEGTVKRRLHHARITIKHELEAMGYE